MLLHDVMFGRPFLYSLNMKVGTVKDVYRAASALKFGNVVSICSDYLMNALTIDNCLGMWKLSMFNLEIHARTVQNE